MGLHVSQPMWVLKILEQSGAGGQGNGYKLYLGDSIFILFYFGGKERTNHWLFYYLAALFVWLLVCTIYILYEC